LPLNPFVFTKLPLLRAPGFERTMRSCLRLSQQTRAHCRTAPQRSAPRIAIATSRAVAGIAMTVTPSQTKVRRLDRIALTSSSSLRRRCWCAAQICRLGPNERPGLLACMECPISHCMDHLHALLAAGEVRQGRGEAQGTLSHQWDQWPARMGRGEAPMTHTLSLTHTHMQQ
jgi:hypothetical protein